jgi:hypothetical protein
MLLLGGPSVNEGWSGIMPLHSTRADVIRLLGDPDFSNQIRAIYALEKEDVYIVFATDQPFFPDCVKQLPDDTVLLIKITPRTEIRLTDLKLDEKKFEKFDPSDPPNLGFEGYVNEDEGIIIRAIKGRVDQICYIAAARDRHLCPQYYKDPKKFIEIIVDFRKN